MVAPLLAAAQALVEVVVVRRADLALAPLLAVEGDVEADPVDPVLGDHLVGQVGGESVTTAVLTPPRSYQTVRTPGRSVGHCAPAWPRPWSPGAAGSSARTWLRALAERGDELRLLARRTPTSTPSTGSSSSASTGDVTDRRAVRRAIEGVERVFHVAGRTSLRDRDREAVFAPTCAARGSSSRRRSRPGSSGSCTPRPWARSASPSRGGTADETTPFEIGHLGPRLRQLQARGRARGVPARRARAAAS